MDPIEFFVGPVSRGAAAVLTGITVAYACLTALYAARGFKASLEDRWSASFAAIVMFLLAALLWFRGAEILPAPFSIWLIAVAIGGIAFTLTYTLGRYQERIDRFQRQFGDRLNQLLANALPEERYDEWLRLRDAWHLDPEERRKAPHLMMGVFLLFYAALGHLILKAIWDLSYGGGLRTDIGPAEGIQNLFAASHGSWLAGGHIFSLFALLGLLFLILPTELLRLKYPELSYPFKSVILSRLRRRERGLFGAHYYITATTALAVAWLARDSATWDTSIPAIASMIAVAVFADSASALVGTRWGRTKWWHYPGKSYLGSAGGTIVAFAVALPFVGLPVAVASAGVFLVVDFLAPMPFPISDNILNPVALALTYTLLAGAIDPAMPYY